MAALPDLLLAMVLRPDAVSRDDLSAQAERDWGWIAARALDHRLAPLLAHHAERESWQVPLPTLEKWQAERTRWTFVHLRQQALLQRIANAMENAGIASVLLKGGSLAQRVYPHPALRPMRDIDLLVAPDHALTVQAMLEDLGCTSPGWAGAASLGDGLHHLPPLRAPDGGRFAIEVHHTLAPRDWPGSAVLARMLLATADPVAMAGTTVRLSAPLPLLLSVVAHGTVHHLLNNGPLFLSDVARLIRQLPPDWDSFERSCAELGLERGAALVFALVERHAGVAPPALALRRAHPVAPALLEHAAALVVQDMTAKEDRRFAAGLRQGGTGLGAATRRALAPEGRTLALRAGTGIDDPRRWVAYPGWLLEKGAGYAKARLATRARADADADNALDTWLRAE